MGLLGLQVVVVLKGIFSFLALLTVLSAVRSNRRFVGTQRICFWFASVFSVIALLWVATLMFLLAHPSIGPFVPQEGWYFVIFGSPTAAVAAGAAMGMYAKSPAPAPSVVQ